MKAEINNSDGLKSLSFHELWARMLTSYTDEYPLVLRLVVITLLVPCDTSECKRVFSLMNDIKTAERNLLGQRNLKNIMLWHALATKVVEGKEGKKERNALAYTEVPVMAILKEWRAMAGPHGRNAHRPVPVPSYDL